MKLLTGKEYYDKYVRSKGLADWFHPTPTHIQLYGEDPREVEHKGWLKNWSEVDRPEKYSQGLYNVPGTGSFTCYHDGEKFSHPNGCHWYGKTFDQGFLLLYKDEPQK